MLAKEAQCAEKAEASNVLAYPQKYRSHKAVE